MFLCYAEGTDKTTAFPADGGTTQRDRFATGVGPRDKVTGVPPLDMHA